MKPNDNLGGLLSGLVILALSLGIFLQQLENKKLENNLDLLKTRLIQTEDSLSVVIDSLETAAGTFAIVGAYTANITVYNGVPGQTDDTPHITANGTVFNPDSVTQERYIALSRDFLRSNGGQFRYGEYVLLEGCRYPELDGIYKVVDTMNKRHSRRGDILVDIGEERNYPWQSRNVTVYKIARAPVSVVTSTL